MSKIQQYHIDFIEHDKSFLKAVNNIISIYFSDLPEKRRRKLFFFFGQINNTDKWYICEDTNTIIYQQRKDGTFNGIPIKYFAKLMEYTLTLRFDDIPLEYSEVLDFAMGYLNHKKASSITADEINMNRVQYS